MAASTSISPLYHRWSCLVVPVFCPAFLFVFIYVYRRFVSEGSFVSFLVCFRARYILLYATQLGVSEQGATPSFFTELAYAYLQPGAIRRCPTGNSFSLRRPNKGVEKACVYARLPRGAKLADSTRHGMRFVCAILGLSLRARIRCLRKKILGWCESALCT